LKSYSSATKLQTPHDLNLTLVYSNRSFISSEFLRRVTLPRWEKCWIGYLNNWWRF